MKLIVNGVEWNPEEVDEKPVTAIEMWYDRHFRHWVIYPVDEEGNQMQEAVYGFGKAEATSIKKELEAEYNIARRTK